jgi:peptide-methionine (S)-S-oxide reductase
MGEPSESLEVVTLGGGCFWCTEAAFLELKGVGNVESGYSGGNVLNPSYGQVCSGVTGHAEVIQITFDPKVISLNVILEVFFTIHDPTTLNHQGADVGTQYRSVIFYRDSKQKEIAEQVIRESSGTWSRPIVTQVVPFAAFYRAEDYHQDYFRKNSGQPYCQVVIAPKVAKLRKYYREKLRATEISR